MRITLHGESDLTLSHLNEPGQEILADEDNAEPHYSALEMFAVSLGLCTLSVIAAYAEQLDVPIDNLRVRLTWDYVENPFRVGKIAMAVTWPEAPESRLKAIERAAAQCTIHNTLHHPPEITTSVSRD